MPQPPLFPVGSRLRSISVDLEDLTLDLVNGVRVTLRLVYDDGARATIMSRVCVDDLAGNLPDEMRSLVEAFLWGEEAKAVLQWAQRLDRSAQSRLVRSTLG